MSNNIEELKKNKYKENIINKQKNIDDILIIVNEYKNKLNSEYNIDIKNNLQIEIKKLNRIIGSKKCSITNSLKTIRKTIGNQISNIDHNVLLLLINYIDSGNSLCNLLLTTKTFNHIIKNDFNDFILIFKCKSFQYMIKIPKYIITEYNIDLEQILYVPLTQEGRTIIHLCARTNNIKLLQSFYNKYPHLNINCLTTHEQWHPAHNALYNRYFKMLNLLLDIGIDNDYTIQIDGYLGSSIQKYIMNRMKHSDVINLQNSIEKCPLKLLSKFNYHILLQDKYIINELTKIYKYILDYKPNLFKIIGNINI